MKNWSGHLQWHPAKVFYPQTQDEVILIIKQAIEEERKIRMIGSGHSFTPLYTTDDFLISLDAYQGIIEIDQAARQVKVKAGTKIRQLNELLDEHGLALENMGDIDVQSIAGAISTGTHGTGTAFGNVSTQVIALTFINGKGETVACSVTHQPSLFKAAQVSLGALGIITEVTLQCVPSYQLHLKVNKMTLAEVVADYDRFNTANRNFEFYWFPNTAYVMTKELTLTNDPPEEATFKDYLQETILENYGFKLFCELSHRFPSWTRKLSKLAAATIDQHKKTNKSYRVFSTERIVRFNEMEYNIPVEAYRDVKKELERWVNKHNYDVLFPIENRFVKGDDIYLSPAYQRDSAYIAVHVYHKKKFQEYFGAIEAIFNAHAGRPHWGKMHTRTANDLAELYPKFEDFKQFRAAQDPQGIFLNAYLRACLGLVPTANQESTNLTSP